MSGHEIGSSPGDYGATRQLSQERVIELVGRFGTKDPDVAIAACDRLKHLWRTDLQAESEDALRTALGVLKSLAAAHESDERVLEAVCTASPPCQPSKRLC